MTAGTLCGIYDFFVGSIGFAETDIVLDGIVEQEYVLENYAEILIQRFGLNIAHIYAADAHCAAAYIPEASHKACQGGLAAA